MSKPKMERGAFAARQRALRLMLNLAMQGALLLVLLVAGAFARDGSRPLYFWAAVVPVGFAAVYVWTYRRGEAARADGSWTLEWEKAESRRFHLSLLAVAVVGVGGAFALLAL